MHAHVTRCMASHMMPLAHQSRSYRLLFSGGRFLPFVWLAKPLNENGTELCRDVQTLEDDLDLALVGYPAEFDPR